MKKSDYRLLQKYNFISRFRGELNRPDYKEYIPSDFERDSVNLILNNQFNEKIDLHNVVILFPLSTDHGRNCLVGKNRIPIDHASNIVRVRHILHEAGVQFKTGESLIDEKYCQTFFTILIVHNGKAYQVNYSADPFDINMFMNKLPIHVQENEIKNLDLDNKQIFFSGLFLENVKNNL